jgi:hypothetical protein
MPEWELHNFTMQSAFFVSLRDNLPRRARHLRML